MGIAGVLVTAVAVAAGLLVLVAVLPLLVRYSKTVRRKLVFSNCVNFPRNLDYENPSNCKVEGGRHVNIEFDSKLDSCPIKIGVWHLLPYILCQELLTIEDTQTKNERIRNELKKTQGTVVIYCHGNMCNRGSRHRLQIYRIFQALGYHIVTFDYRGYGDSTDVRPTERGVVEDTLHVYCWFLEELDSVRKPVVILWGHSLGAAVASSMIGNLSELCGELGRNCPLLPDALILEAPFNNLTEAIEGHPFSKLVSWLPYFKDTVVKPFSESQEYTFATDQNLSRVPNIPVLMMHSKTDGIVPHKLAVKLHDHVAQSRGSDGALLQFHTIGHGHRNLCEAPELPQIVRNFMESIQDATR